MHIPTQQVGPHTITLRDSRTVTIRTLEEGDHQALLAFGKLLPQDDWLYLRHDLQNPQTVARLATAAAAENWRQMVAAADGAIVGYSNVRRLPGWSDHVGDIHLSVSAAWRRVLPLLVVDNSGTLRRPLDPLYFLIILAHIIVSCGRVGVRSPDAQRHLLPDRRASALRAMVTLPLAAPT